MYNFGHKIIYTRWLVVVLNTPLPHVVLSSIDKEHLCHADSKKKEYVEWITEAKTDATRDKRLSTTIEWLAEGKARNWKYQKC